MVKRSTHEQRKVVTLYGDRGWHDPMDSDYTFGSIQRGYRNMNVELNKLGEHVTIHSVSINHVIFPTPGPVKQCRIFAEVVYSGSIDLFSFFGATNFETGHPYPEDNTVFHVHL